MRTAGSATDAAIKASRNALGSSFPLFSARRRIPRQAVALKKYRRGTSPVSKMSDNEDATAPLWYSKELSVKHSVGEPIPEFDQPSEDGSKVPSASRRQDAGHVLPNQPSGAEALSKPKKFEGQVATVIGQAASKARDRERLAGGSSNKKVDWFIFVLPNVREVAVQRGCGPARFQDRAGKWFDLR